MGEIVAVIDTETNYSNRLISIGVVAADISTYEIADEYYGIYDPAYRSMSMFGYVLKYEGVPINNIASSGNITQDVLRFITDNGIKRIFAYNAKFDHGLLPELHGYEWYDIMRLAAYRQYNRQITDEYECCKTGRLKKNYGVEGIYRMLSENSRYTEVHNALADARDELQIMKYLGRPLSDYEIARIH